MNIKGNKCKKEYHLQVQEKDEVVANHNLLFRTLIQNERQQKRDGESLTL